MPKVRGTSDPEIVTPPTPLPIPSPTYEKEEGERFTAQGEVITEPRNRYVGDTHAEIPEYEGSYLITENGTIPCGGYEMISDLVVDVEPKGLTQITITENGTYKPTEYGGYSQVTVAIPTYSGSYSVAENATLPTKGKLMTDDLTVNVPTGGNTLKTLLDATKSTYSLFNGYQGNDIADLISYGDTSEVTGMGNMFNGCPNLTTIPLLDTSKVTLMNGMFRFCVKLASIPALDASKVTTFANAFIDCFDLTEIKMTGMSRDFDISYSTRFTREALVEIITNCATVTSATLTMGSTNLAKLTQADIDLATSKGWTLA